MTISSWRTTARRRTQWTVLAMMTVFAMMTVGSIGYLGSTPTTSIFGLASVFLYVFRAVVFALPASLRPSLDPSAGFVSGRALADAVGRRAW